MQSRHPSPWAAISRVGGFLEEMRTGDEEALAKRAVSTGTEESADTRITEGGGLVEIRDRPTLRVHEGDALIHSRTYKIVLKPKPECDGGDEGELTIEMHASFGHEGAGVDEADVGQWQIERT